tara:strand:+ start:1758 stop:4694 length:2937 start_codon:yes stop_codon:yes gene_type:complete
MIEKESFISPVHNILSYKVADWSEIEPIVTNEASSNGGTFQFRNMEYSYRDWLDSNHPDRSTPIRDGEITNLQYDKLLIIDLFGGDNDLDWHSLFNRDNDGLFINNLLNDIYDIVNKVMQHDVQDADDRRILYKMYGGIFDNEDILDAFDGVQSTEVINRGYGSAEIHPLFSILNRTFYVQPWQYPEGVRISMEDMAFLRQRVFMATSAARFWKKMPLRYICLPLPSETYKEFLYEERDIPESIERMDSNYLMWSDNLVNLYQTGAGNGYYGGSTSAYDHARFYDFHEDRWKPREHRWGGRQYRECTICRLMYNAHFLTWYKTLDSYSRSARERICFICNTFTTSSYNPSKKSWVKLSPKVSYDTNQQYEGMGADWYVNYIHGNDSPRARGSRDYMIKYIDDANYQDIEVFNDEYVEDAVTMLQVDARKYMTWLYTNFKGVPGDIRSQVITDVCKFRVLEDSSSAGQHNHDAVGGYLEDDSNSPISGADFARMVGLQLPNVYIYSSDNPLADTIISLRIDNALWDREFRYQSRGRNGRNAQARVTDDGWIEPPGIGLELNKDKNEYNYSPRFYYVHYRDGMYYNQSTDTPTVGVVNSDRCTCTSDDCREQNRSHPSRPEWHHTRGVSMGLELELIARDSRLLDEIGPPQLFERTVEVFHPKGLENQIGAGAYNTQLLYSKRDGSLPSETGVEFISQPMSLAAWHAVPTKFWNFVEANYKAFQVEDVGIHIHFPWASMEVGHAYAMLSALNSLQINPNGMLRKVAQRADVSYSRWDLLTFRDAYNVVAEVAKQRTRSDNDKYKGINLQHSNTIELRYFQSNAKGDRILKNLEFVDAIYELTKRDYLNSGGWDTERDVPTASLIETAVEYGNQSPKAKIDTIHDEEVPFANHIEKQIYDYVIENPDRYPNLYSFLLDTNEETSSDRTIELEDIGYWETPVEMEEEDIQESVSFFINGNFVFESETITVDDIEYTNAMIER